MCIQNWCFRLGLNVIMKGVFLFEKHYYYVNLVEKLQQNRTDKNVTNVMKLEHMSVSLCKTSLCC